MWHAHTYTHTGSYVCKTESQFLAAALWCRRSNQQASGIVCLCVSMCVKAMNKTWTKKREREKRREEKRRKRERKKKFEIIYFYLLKGNVISLPWAMRIWCRFLFSFDGRGIKAVAMATPVSRLRDRCPTSPAFNIIPFFFEFSFLTWFLYEIYLLFCLQRNEK